MTEAIMLGEGERAERQRRRRVWGAFGATAVFGLPIGFFLGRSAGRNKGSMAEAFSDLPQFVTIGLLALSVFSFLWACWYFLKSVDEVEVADNLWASTAGFYFYMVSFPIWWVLWKAKIAVEPQDWIILAASLASGTIVYLFRKWRAR
ncbi:MAG: hypothetical protein ABI667_02905 [Sphingomicrobium sp.]